MDACMDGNRGTFKVYMLKLQFPSSYVTLHMSFKPL